MVKLGLGAGIMAWPRLINKRSPHSARAHDDRIGAGLDAAQGNKMATCRQWRSASICAVARHCLSLEGLLAPPTRAAIGLFGEQTYEASRLR